MADHQGKQIVEIALGRETPGQLEEHRQTLAIGLGRPERNRGTHQDISSSIIIG
jgi:hypothetical protein